jgi:hypothetical protein
MNKTEFLAASLTKNLKVKALYWLSNRKHLPIKPLMFWALLSIY